jgi:hypothetical protein
MTASKSSKKGNRLRITLPKRGDVVLTAECDLEVMRGNFESTLRNMSARRSEEEINTIVHDAFEYAVKHMDQVLGAALMRIRSEAFDVATRSTKIVKVTGLEVHGALLKIEDQEARERLNIRSPGQTSRWTVNELAGAVQEALESLPAHEKTYPKVAALLKKSHPEKAPPSGQALRKLLQRKEIDWWKFKRGHYSVP